MNDWHELVTLLAGFLATSFAVLRLTVGQSKGLLDRFAALTEDTLHRQGAAIDSLRAAVLDLRDGVRENTLLVRQVAEWLQVSTPLGRG